MHHLIVYQMYALRREFKEAIYVELLLGLQNNPNVFGNLGNGLLQNDILVYTSKIIKQ